MREDLPALGGVRQVDEEDLVEAALAQQLGRQREDVVRGRDHEHLAAVFSWSQVRKRGEARAGSCRRRPRRPAREAFSISSIHSTTGAIDSAISIARRRFFSVSPTYLS